MLPSSMSMQKSNTFSTGLSKLLSYDPEKEGEIEGAMLAIKDDFDTAQNDIDRCMQQNRIEFDQKVLIVIFDHKRTHI